MTATDLPERHQTRAIPGPLGRLYVAAANAAQAIIPYWLIALAVRAGVGMVFFKSGQTKLAGDWEISNSAYLLFQNEYFPELSDSMVDVLTVLATVAENVCGLLLILGVLARLNALALLGMTAVIQFGVWTDWSKLAEFANPFQAWDIHLFWAGALLLIIARGPGAASIDAAAGALFGKKSVS